jgi:hypothetical protein
VEEKQAIKDKLISIEREKTNLVVQSIKTSTKLMTKINNALDVQNTSSDVLMKIKIFLKMTRIIIENTKQCINDCQGGSQKLEFFQM